LLAKAVARYPGGVTDRWEKISQMVGRSVKEVCEMAISWLLEQVDFVPRSWIRFLLLSGIKYVFFTTAIVMQCAWNVATRVEQRNVS